MSLEKYIDQAIGQQTEDKIGNQIAETLGVIYNGFQPAFGRIKKDAFVFTDPITRSTFFASNENEARDRLKLMRLKFESKCL
jgi:hypothetical protein